MKKLILIMICFMFSLAGYARVTSSKDYTKLNFSNRAEYKNFVAKLNNSALLLKSGDCNAKYCSEVYEGCVANNIKVIQESDPGVVIEGNMEIQFELTSYCTLLTSLAYSICKEQLTEAHATIVINNYNEAKGLLYEESQKKNKK